MHGSRLNLHVLENIFISQEVDNKQKDGQSAEPQRFVYCLRICKTAYVNR